MKRKVVIGQTWSSGHHAMLTIEQALKIAQQTAGEGYIWVSYRNHYKIIANYYNGQVFNGQARLVPATPDSCLASLIAR